MGLKGQFPKGIENCTSLTGLDLSSNNLSGPVPLDISKRLPFVTTLDLSSNDFSGPIPASLANCSYLASVKLDNNQLTGSIPIEFSGLNRLKTFSVSNNRLSGRIPHFSSANATISADNFANNLGLCGPPLDNECIGAPKKSHGAVIIGSAVAGVVVTLLVVSVVVFLLLKLPIISGSKQDIKRNRWAKAPLKMLSFLIFLLSGIIFASLEARKKFGPTFMSGYMVGWGMSMPPSIAFLSIYSRWMSKRKQQHQKNKQQNITGGTMNITKTSLSEEVVTEISLGELMKLTNNFNQANIIGSGRTGTIYKAKLQDGTLLAIKRFQDSEHVERQFKSELMILGKVKHRNLVPLLGFCSAEEQLLIYKYTPNGNLYDLLHPEEANGKAIEWPQRLRIGIGLARGLAWLHYNCDNRIVHRNISSKSILLDENFEPKLSNFGFATLLNLDESHMSSTTFMTCEADMDYVAAEYIQTPVPALKRDVYNFGVVLLELLTGEKPTHVTKVSESFNGGLVEWIAHLLDRNSSPFCAIDKCLIGKGFDGEIIQSLRIACNCVLSSPKERPKMFVVYQTLKAVGQRYDFTDQDDLLI
ncbi:PREDICTED: probably inactive leucine-rich repeat receptor-like protein kinase At5g48380 [Nelumbo nucifera]|uniref:Probably inactive leucine-rich repeat receptor-like protein kinase At5g48380 n=1 Tax=Nelumbo nucifera TaxID=4432 RepID=A0A1U7Z6F7_NELNU|nr:PREDICTED: probably inactive leucine-rich repeat receptor-like protein kinase At5g48380 [Nelumbo nucifera]